jgi:hypothetical protein
MMIGRRQGVVLLASLWLAACSPSSPVAPTTVSRAPQPSASRLAVFTELATGFSTSDLRDVDEQILQITTAGELVWIADGTRLQGYGVAQNVIDGVPIHWISGTLCPEGCAFEVRFGERNGERRAYLTADYGHENPGTLVDVEVAGGTLAVARTGIFPPGAPVLSGVVFEETPTGRAPVAAVTVQIGISSGWRSAVTDANGLYSIPGLFDIQGSVRVSKEGYQAQTASVAIRGNTVLDIGLMRR